MMTAKSAGQRAPSQFGAPSGRCPRSQLITPRSVSNMNRHINPTATGVSSIGMMRTVRKIRVPLSARSRRSARPSPIGS